MIVLFGTLCSPQKHLYNVLHPLWMGIIYFFLASIQLFWIMLRKPTHTRLYRRGEENIVSIKLFVLGRSGSGKSTTVHYLQDAAQKRGWSIAAFNEYDILHAMFKQDTKHEQFRATNNGGFEVLDLNIYTQSLQKLEKEIHNSSAEAEEQTLITIEFASNNYLYSLQQFSPVFLENAHCVFLAADLGTCLQRVNQRALHPQTKDDYFVPDVVLLHHYPCPYIAPGEDITILPNMASLRDLQNAAEELLATLIAQHTQRSFREPVGALN